jgi:hypothetical protein
VSVQAANTDIVALRGLTISRSGGVGSGIDIASARVVHIEDCEISGFLIAGVSIHPSANAYVTISDTVLRENESGVSAIAANASGAASRIEIWRTRADENNGSGFTFSDMERVGIIDSHCGGNQIGVRWIGTTTSGTNPSIAIDRTTIADNTVAGISVLGGPGIAAVANVANSTITGNQTGIVAASAGVVRFTTSQLTGNGTAITLSGTGIVDSLTTNMNYGNNSAGNAPGTLVPN